MPHEIKVDYGPARITHAEELPGWMEPYSNFLHVHCRFRSPRLRVACDDEMPTHLPGTPIPLPGDSHGRTYWPWKIRLSLRVRGSLYDNRQARSLGAHILFRQAAFCEFWQTHPLSWILTWWRDPKRWQALADARARELMEIWVKCWPEGYEKETSPRTANPGV